MIVQEVKVQIEQVIELARKASRRIMEIYEDEQIDWNVEAKSDKSPLTIADKESNAIICAGLEASFPHIPILSEEKKNASFDERKNWPYCWVVDPLDGTKEFIKKNGEFTVNIALVAHGKPVMGVVFVPAQDVMYYAEQGKGAYKVEAEQQTSKLQAALYDKSLKGMKVVSSRSHMNDETRDFVSQFDSPELMSAGSSLKFMLVAEGTAHVYPRIAPTMEWDTAAAQIVVEESGGSVVNFTTGEALAYNKENLLNPYFVVYGRV